MKQTIPLHQWENKGAQNTAKKESVGRKNEKNQKEPGFYTTFARMMRVHYGFTQLPDFQKTVLTIGSFDGLHAGHKQLLRRVKSLAKQAGAESVVITFDPHPRAVFEKLDSGFKLITTTSEKISLLQDCAIDHLVIVPFTPEFAAQSAQEYVEQFLLRHFQPHTIVIGYDHRFGNDRQGDIQFLKKYADKGTFFLEEISAQEVDHITVSSSKIRTALESGALEAANRLLGHPFTLTGKVVKGNQIGRTIGFPTANLQIEDSWKILPPDGIYAASVRLEGYPKAVYHAMLYLGNRPSLEGQSERRIELNILGLEGDLYGLTLQVKVHQYIRGDKKLDNLEQLKAQIAEDQIAIEAYFEDNNRFPEELDIAVVILNYNTRSHLEQYLPSVLANSGTARIIVADNGSPDDSIAFLNANFPQVEVLDLEFNFGFAEGYNRALQNIKSDYYVILNSDVEVTPNWIQPIIGAMEKDRQIGVAQPKILEDKRRDRFEHAGAAGGWLDYLGYPFCRGRIFTHVEQDLGQYDTAQPCFWAAGAAFFIRSKLYHQLGGFDGDYFAHNEEIDLCWRVQRAGYSVWCFPESIVYHLGGGTLSYDSPRKVFLNFRNSLFTLVKNEPVAKLIWLIPARLVLDGVAGGMYLAKGQFKAIQSIIQAHFSFYKHVGKLIQKRKEAANRIFESQLSPKKSLQGVYFGSIVFAFYIQRIKHFSEVVKKKGV